MVDGSLSVVMVPGLVRAVRLLDSLDSGVPVGSAALYRGLACCEAAEAELRGLPVPDSAVLEVPLGTPELADARGRLLETMLGFDLPGAVAGISEDGGSVRVGHHGAGVVEVVCLWLSLECHCSIRCSLLRGTGEVSDRVGFHQGFAGFLASLIADADGGPEKRGAVFVGRLSHTLHGPGWERGWETAAESGLAISTRFDYTTLTDRQRLR